MELEQIEQASLEFLKHSERPLVPLETLWRHVSRGEGGEEISQDRLLGFLRQHELFQVIDPTGPVAGGANMAMLAEMGFPVGPQVILCTRVPTSETLIDQMGMELGKMIDALARARSEAQNQGNEARAQLIGQLLSHAEALHDRLEEFG